MKSKLEKGKLGPKDLYYTAMDEYNSFPKYCDVKVTKNYSYIRHLCKSFNSIRNIKWELNLRYK